MDLEILKIASNTKNHKTIKNFTHSCKNRNRICGDVMEISIIVKNNKITDFGYQCKSCIYCQASASLFSRNVKHKTIDKIELLLKQSNNLFKNKKINSIKEWKSFLKLLNKTNIARKECLLLPIKATLKALKN